MATGKKTVKRVNAIITGTFEKHLRFLQHDTGLEHNALVRLAIADLANRRGYSTTAASTKKKPGA